MSLCVVFLRTRNKTHNILKQKRKGKVPKGNTENALFCSKQAQKKSL